MEEPLDNDFAKQEPFLVFRIFPDAEELKEYADFLRENKVTVQTEIVQKDPHSSVTFSNFLSEYRLKIKKSDFLKVEELFIRYAENLIADLPKDYYLFSFTTDELKDVVMKQDEWNTIDFILASKLLQDKNVWIDREELNNYKVQRIEELSRPEKRQWLWIVIGYFSVLFGGFLGIIIGWHLYYHKKTLYNGDRVYDYCEKDRTQGLIIGVLGLVMFVLLYATKVLNFLISV